MSEDLESDQITTPDEENSQQQNKSTNDTGYSDVFKQFDVFKQKGLHFVHFNTRSLLSKIEEIKLFASECRVSVIAISESWLDSTVTNNEVAIPGYNIVRRDRNRNGGGVCLYIHEDIPFSERSDLQSDSVEAVWVELYLRKTKPILICSCYRPPNQNDFNGEFENVLSQIRSDMEWLILGDFNMCLKDKSNGLIGKYQQLLNIFNLKQIISSPTRVTDSTSTLLDHILVNHDDKISQSGTLPVNLSDHYPIFCTRKHTKNKTNKHNTVKIRCMKNYDAEQFIYKLKLCDWNKMFTVKSVQESWLFFKDTFLSVVNEVAPIKEVRLKQRTEPWMDSYILDLIKSRDLYMYKYKKTGNKEFYKMFCLYRNRVQRAVKKAKSNYISDRLEEHKDNPKTLWSQIKSLGYSNNSKSSPSVVLTIKDGLCFEAKKIADHFNHFFTTVASVLVNKLPAAPNIFNTTSVAFNDFYKERNPKSKTFKLHTVSENVVYRELSKLNCSKSTGLDDISARFLKDSASFIKLHITFLINSSIVNNIVPNDLKSAKVKPLFKKNKRSEVSNYRPVSILSIVSKILERAVYNQLESFFVNNGLLYEYQSGFRRSYSTDSCLIHLTDHIREQTSKGLFTGMVMIDLQKAFDTVDHDILCRKLLAMGVESVEWFRSYLTDRTQSVHVNGAKSDFSSVVCGVPQGSILGPLLFLAYVNDMKISISSNCKLILYADDSAILFSHKDPSYISHVLGKELENCSKWLIDNKLSLHLGKTECILFGSKRKLNNIKNFSIKCNDHEIKSQTSVKYLGSIIDADLSGTSIVNSIVKKVNSRISFLYRQQQFLNKSLRKTLCNALIQCHLDYASSSWYSGLTKQLKNKLQISQNKIVRFIHNIHFRTSLSVAHFKDIGYLNVDQRCRQLRLNHVRKVFLNKSPSYLKDHFMKRNELHSYENRSSHTFFVPQVNSFTANSFYYNAIKDWNNLPVEIKTATSDIVFKRLVKKYLLTEMEDKENSEFIYF